MFSGHYAGLLYQNGQHPQEKPHGAAGSLPAIRFGGTTRLHQCRLHQRDRMAGCLYITTTPKVLEALLQVHGEREVNEKNRLDMCRELSNVLAGNASHAFGADWTISVPQSVTADNTASLNLPPRPSSCLFAGKKWNPTSWWDCARKTRNNMNSTKIFHNTWSLQQLPVAMKLSNTEWRFLLCADGKTSVHQIQKRLALSDKEQETILGRLLQSGLLTESTQSLEELARATIDLPSTSTEPQTLNDYLRSSLPADSSREKEKEKTLPSFQPAAKTPRSLPRPCVPLEPASCHPIHLESQSRRHGGAVGDLPGVHGYQDRSPQAKRNHLPALPGRPAHHRPCRNFSRPYRAEHPEKSSTSPVREEVYAAPAQAAKK